MGQFPGIKDNDTLGTAVSSSLAIRWPQLCHIGSSEILFMTDDH